MSDDDSPLRHTERITLALSNQCVYAHMHPKCPASLATTEKRVLPRIVVRDVIQTAACWGWGRDGQVIAWHTYNEPTNDPRLTELCRLAKTHMPRCKIHLWTNGWYLTDELCVELYQSGVDKIRVSAYSRAEYDRLNTVADAVSACPLDIGVWHETLDDRMDHHDRPRARPCRAPLRDLTIYSSSRIGLCCMDWREEATFGELDGDNFADLLLDQLPAMMTLRDRLMVGDRTLPVCRSCTRRR